MMTDALEGLYSLVRERKSSPQEGSYTCYLFEKGLDKILKKVGEECAETIIAAKNGDNAATCEETADLLYHVLVMLAQQNIPLEQVSAVLEQRRQKIGNLKTLHTTDRET